MVAAGALLLLLLCVCEVGAQPDAAGTPSPEDVRREDQDLKLEGANAEHGAQSSIEARLTAVEGKVQELYQWCPNGWKKFGPSCYYRTTEFKTWQQGREECQSYGADLVVVNSREEQVFIRGLKTGDYNWSWIGLSKSSEWAAWTWVDGSPLTTPYWDSGYPSNSGDRNCADYRHSTDPGTWGNGLDGCSDGKPSICEK